MCIFFVVFIAVINLRGVRSRGAFFAGPTYLFIFSMLALIVVGFVRYWTNHQVMATPAKVYFDPSVGAIASHALTAGALLWLLMRAFAAGCTALTGVEAISNGIPAFKQPESKNAATTLTLHAFIMAILILGSGSLPTNSTRIPRQRKLYFRLFGRQYIRWWVRLLRPSSWTAAILVLAANTSFADFPRLASLLAADRSFRANSQAAATAWSFPMALSFLRCWPAFLSSFSKATNKQCSRSTLWEFLSPSRCRRLGWWFTGAVCARRMKQSERSKKKQKIHRTQSADIELPATRPNGLQAIERDVGGNWLSRF